MTTYILNFTLLSKNILFEVFGYIKIEIWISNLWVITLCDFNV